MRMLDFVETLLFLTRFPFASAMVAWVRLSLTTKMVSETAQLTSRHVRLIVVSFILTLLVCTGEFQGSMGTDENSVPQRVNIPVAGIDLASGLALLDQYRGQRITLENPLETKNAAGEFVSGGGYGYLSGTSILFLSFFSLSFSFSVYL
jgi:hypothetical protein